MVFVDRAAVIHHPWCGFRVGMTQAVNCATLGEGDFQIGIAFIVTKQNVVARLEAFDEVVFQQQGLGLRAHHGGFKADNFAHHMADAGAAMVFLEVAADALL